MEQDECYHRLGYLNLFNPMLPDHDYRLDLRSWEQRELCKLLVKLGIEEPGENWQNETYKWIKDSDPIPGWT